MRKIILAIFLTLFTVSNASARPVLVELFTSQGCSACPAGEKTISKLNNRDDFFALSFHVDYWDKLGWKDKFAKSEFTQRQTRYMRKFDNRTVFTPQAVLDGEDETNASWGWRVKMLSSSIRDKQIDVPIHYSENESGAVVKISAQSNVNPANVWYVNYVPNTKTQIMAGSNKGREMHSVNVVRHLEKLSSWDGSAQEVLLPKPQKGTKVAIFLQEEGLGKVLGLYYQ